MGKSNKVPPRASPKKLKKRAKCRGCENCLERHEPPTDKKCTRLQTPGLQVGEDPNPGPPGLFAPSTSAESASAEEIRLASSRFPESSTTVSTPQRPEMRQQDSSQDLVGDEAESEEEEENSDEYEQDEQTDLEREDQESSDDGQQWEEIPGESDDDMGTNAAYLEFNKVTTDILNRLQKSEQPISHLEKMLNAKQSQLDKANRLHEQDPPKMQEPPPVRRLQMPTAAVGQPDLPTQPEAAAIDKTQRPGHHDPAGDEPQSGAGRDTHLWDRWGWDTTSTFTDEVEAGRATEPSRELCNCQKVRDRWS